MLLHRRLSAGSDRLLSSLLLLHAPCQFLRIERRRSSDDISLLWAAGVFVCLLLMLPSGLTSADRVFKLFSIINIVFFGAVVVQVIRYR